MRTLFLFCLTSLVAQLATHAQSAFSYAQLHAMGRSNVVGTSPGPLTRGLDGRLYGAAETSSAGVGNLYRLDTNGANPEVIHRFADDGMEFSTQQKLVYARDDRIYGWAHTIGSSTAGALFRLEPNGANFQLLIDSAQVQTVGWRELVDGSDNRIYALAGNRIVRVNRDGSGFQSVHTNQSSSALDQLFEGSDGKLYGVESTGAGLIISIDKNGSNRTVVRDFATSPVPGAATPRTVFESRDGSLYGTLSGMGAPGTLNAKIFRVNRDGSDFTVVRDVPAFFENGLNYGNLIDSLIEGRDDWLYGSLPNSGLQKPGYAFRVSKDGNLFTNLFEWPATYLAFDSGANVNRSTTKFLVEGSDGRMHGTTRTTGTASGALYRFNADGSDFETVIAFHTTNGHGTTVNAGLAQGTNGVLYGVARNGGPNNNGTIFRLQPDGRAFTVLKTFASTSQGENPAGVLVGSDGLLYGVMEGGGASGFGTVFRMHPDGSSYTRLRDFLASGADGRVPLAGLIEGSDGALYGSTTFGGGAAAGTLFTIARSGTGYAILHRFTNTISGSNVTARLLEGADGRLYGSALLGGPQRGGTVFTLTKSGTGFTLLRAFHDTGTSLRQPRGALVQGSDGTLYGTTSAGGSNGFGGLFRVQTNGTGFQTLYEFSSSNGDGRAPDAGLAFGVDGWLYGVTRFGGGAVNGSIFRLHPNGTGYEKLRAFTGSGGDGGNPVAALTRGMDGALYGTTSSGGAFSFGTLFRILGDLPLPQLAVEPVAGSAIRISWPASATGFQLEFNLEVADRPAWSVVQISPTLSNGSFTITTPATNAIRFFRLHRR